ncbi:hypothetical protein EHN07_05275 [Buttiauxella warmboldiae]|uniref:Uncharacterized protein n=1 Tax=Buttiauxella warmboldiae TaxID=82993 RepID=A0A3N5DQZ4_9ENTR|nr:hypothetical protein [Buttiauxella warmboldiae]RPH29621.1 hypothetical protein EHN07_05275 [Buttiauxella warmboldiae]
MKKIIKPVSLLIPIVFSSFAWSHGYVGEHTGNNATSLKPGTLASRNILCKTTINGKGNIGCGSVMYEPQSLEAPKDFLRMQMEM